MKPGLKVRSIVVICLSLLLMLSGRSEGSTNNNFFLVTSNAELWNSTIWEVYPPENIFKSIYTVPGTKPVSARSDFPADEMTKLDNILAQGSLPFIDPDKPGIGHHINAAWLIDSQRLLVLERTEVCDRVNGGYCYGYFEFLILDRDTGVTTSIYEIGYHDDIYDSWECPNVRGLFVDEVLVNPLFDQVAFSVTSYKWCYAEKSVPSAGYIVDFSTTPVQVTVLPNADGLSWSPDGERLAYFVRSSCKGNQTASVNVLPVNPPVEAIVLREEPQYCRNPMFVDWLDDQTVLYEWKPDSAGSEDPSKLLWHNISTDNSISTSMLYYCFKEALVRLSDSQSTALVGTGDRQLIVLPVDRDSDCQILFNKADRLFYNSRLPQYIFTNLSETSVQRVDASLTITEIDLERFFEEHSQEWISHITPG